MTEPSPSPSEPPQIAPPPRAPRSEAHALRRLLLIAVALIVLGGGGLLAWDWLSHERSAPPYVRPLPQTADRAAPEPPQTLTPTRPTPSPSPAPHPESSSPAAQPAAPQASAPSASPATRPPQVEDLSARLSALEVRLAQATAAPAPPAQPAPASPADAQVAELEARVAALENAVAAERKRADRAEAEARRVTARLQTMGREAAALAGLRTNLERGYPFEREYDNATTVLASDPDARARLAPMRQWAESGIPTRAALREALESQGGDIVRASILEGAGTWWQALVARVKALIVSRPTPDGDIPAAGTPEGDRAPAIVARAEARLRDGDVPAALSELSSLTGAAADTAQAWVAAARARISADETMAALEESLRAPQSASQASEPAARTEPSRPDQSQDKPVDRPDASEPASAPAAPSAPKGEP
jgi:uncharacterized coiled-coil protein SlyX